jgi:peptide/nickel transport system ATP-binding protein/oligopeptide transport system ATP-binding protein
MSLLEVEDLRTHFVSRGPTGETRVARALNGVSLSVDAGETLGLVGESGAGKSLTTLSVLGLLRPPARVVAGRARFDGTDLLALPENRLARLRGNQIAIVVQNPKVSLDPLTRVGDQIARVSVAHGRADRRAARAGAIRLLEAVGIPDPARRAQAYPHELSGGMAQRVMIAMALINEPRLLIADEPTTGLDLTIQAQVLDLLAREVAARRLACILITHDLGVVAHYCRRIAVMFAGSIVEQGPVERVFSAPIHPYTRALLASARPVGNDNTDFGRHPPPDLYALPPGCAYADRCPRATEVCRTAPPPVTRADAHVAWCHQPEPG